MKVSLFLRLFFEKWLYVILFLYIVKQIGVLKFILRLK